MDELTVDGLLQQPSFINYCTRANEPDVHFWEQWLRQHPEHTATFREAEEMVKSMGWLLIAEYEKAGAMARMDAYLQKPAKKKPVMKPVYWWAAVAAAVAGLMVGQRYLQQAKQHAPAPAPLLAQQLHYAAGGKERSSFMLPDSTYVLLEKNSSLDIDRDYNAANRHVKLNGTGYFRIRGKASLPFDVEGGGYLVTALGTAFKMTARSGGVHVMLEQGKVKVEQGTGNQKKLLVYLQPMQSFASEAADASGTQQVFEPKALAAWKIQEIIFENTPLQEVVFQLESCYNVKINVEGMDINKETFSGKFRNDSLQSVLDVLCFAVNKQYEFTDETNVLIK
ncbi:FecR family protein [Chitinophaga jiangningensis]|uniref:FecR family protein n=1 Tax=Chitinophaga jiangningensis TaxID=1419482 RepID=A0A1M7LPK4_9BACT|nr:FecR domain-containing protein [Chitinophaga jiangningensis]SHM80121.1 FecR family protein [Chitinophaga jiangningensis]